jgi:hypothetical protein
MCPKSKPTETVLHRIELQQTERDALEMVAASITARNVTASVGNLITPILSASAAGVAAGLGMIAWWEIQSVERDTSGIGPTSKYFTSPYEFLTPEQKAKKQQSEANFRMKLSQFRNAISTELMKLTQRID